MMLKELLEEVYSNGTYDNWSGELIGSETDKIHATVKVALEAFTGILNNATSTPEERKWARDKIDQLL